MGAVGTVASWGAEGTAPKQPPPTAVTQGAASVRDKFLKDVRNLNLDTSQFLNVGN